MNWFVWFFLRSCFALHPADLSCKKRDYRLLTDQSDDIIYHENTSITIRIAIGLDNDHVDRTLTRLWREQIVHQPVTLQSSWQLFQASGKLNDTEPVEKNASSTWTFTFSSIPNLSDFTFAQPKPVLAIQSTLFTRPIDLVIRTNNFSHSDPIITTDYCHHLALCTSWTNCSNIRMNSEHSRRDLIVTDRAVIVPSISNKFICLQFPSNDRTRFWSTLTGSMNIGQMPDENDIVLVQRNDRMPENRFHFSSYPFSEWYEQRVDFDFVDILLIPHKQLAIFEIFDCYKMICNISLRIYTYQLRKPFEFHRELDFMETIIETNVSSTVYHLYFDMFSAILYLIGTRKIYLSNDYGVELHCIWTGNRTLQNSTILKPIAFVDTGHLAFVYRLHPTDYFAVFSKAGLHYALSTRTFRSSLIMDEPFSFDYSGSLYFNASPPLLVIQATEQSLIGTNQLLDNIIFGPFFVRETDMDKWFVFCSFFPWHERFELVGSTLSSDELGVFLVMMMDRSLSQFGFCLQTSRLDKPKFSPVIPRQCQLLVRFSNTDKKVYLDLTGDPDRCVFTDKDKNATLVTSKIAHIFIEHIDNVSHASGIIFEDTISNDVHVIRNGQWTIIPVQMFVQKLDRCLLKNLDQKPSREPLVYIKPKETFAIFNNDHLASSERRINHLDILSNDAHVLYHENEVDNQFQLTASPFVNRKSVIRQRFSSSQMSCYLPHTRTTTYITQCLPNAVIRPQFKTDFDLSSIPKSRLPVNFQLHRRNAGYTSVIAYNLDEHSNSVCDGFIRCSCISSLTSQYYPVICADQLYTFDSTVNNPIYITLRIESDRIYVPKMESLFLVEELSLRRDFEVTADRLIDEIRQQTITLFRENFHRLTKDELRLFELLTNPLPAGKFLFTGPHLTLQLLDEGLYHFRLTYLWGDHFCGTSRDLLIMMISNVATLTSSTFGYLIACIIILFFMSFLWIYLLLFDHRIQKIRHQKRETNFHPRTIHYGIDFEMLVAIREQSERLLPYRHLLPAMKKLNKQTSDMIYSADEEEERIARSHHRMLLHEQQRRYNIFVDEEHLVEQQHTGMSSSLSVPEVRIDPATNTRSLVSSESKLLRQHVKQLFTSLKSKPDDKERKTSSTSTMQSIQKC